MIALTMVAVTCALGAQSLNFQFTPGEAIQLSNRLRSSDPHSIGFRTAVCSNLQEALETVEGEPETEYPEDGEECGTDSECEGLTPIEPPVILSVRGK